MDKLKIIDNEDLVRDVHTNAVINTSKSSLEAYKQKRDAQRTLVQDIDGLKSEMADIKQLLQQLIAEKNK